MKRLFVSLTCAFALFAGFADAEKLPRIHDSLVLRVAVETSETCDDLMRVYDFTSWEFFQVRFEDETYADFARDVIIHANRLADAKFVDLRCHLEPRYKEWLEGHDFYKESKND